MLARELLKASKSPLPPSALARENFGADFIGETRDQNWLFTAKTAFHVTRKYHLELKAYKYPRQ